MKPKKIKHFATEAALCSAFVAALDDRWTPFAETAGWDLLLVRVADGFQIGVQAKLRLNPFVLAQALDETRYSVTNPGPDCRAVLVPWGEVQVGISYLCAYVGVTVLRMEPPHVNRYKPTWSRRFEPALPEGKNHSDSNWFEQAPTKRCKLPEYVPDVVAGKPSPVQLTEWKICALKIAVLLEKNGHVTRADFRHIGIDHRRWISPGTEWLSAGGVGFVPGRRFPNFRGQHPVVFEQIKADAHKWMPKQELLL